MGRASCHSTTILKQRSTNGCRSSTFGDLHSLAVVTKDMKYVYWPWAEGDFKAVDELYHLGDDPLELTNQVASASYAGALEKMRTHYDDLVARWKREAVPYHDYQRFGTMFDRTVAWSEKASPSRRAERKRQGK